MLTQQLEDAAEAEEVRRLECVELWKKLETAGQEKDAQKHLERTLTKELDEVQGLQAAAEKTQAALGEAEAQRADLEHELARAVAAKDEVANSMADRLAVAEFNRQAEADAADAGKAMWQAEAEASRQHLQEKEQLLQTLTDELQQLYRELDDSRARHATAIALVEGRATDAETEAIELR